MTTKTKRKKPDYRRANKCLLLHIKELEERIDQKDNLMLCAKDLFIYYRMDKGEDERTATREVYQTIYGDEWIDHIPYRYLTKEEDREKFDKETDALVTRGDYLANMNYLDIARWHVKEESHANWK